MAAEDVLILGVGMMTSVGLSAPETAASVRAGTMRLGEIPWCDKCFEPFVFAEVVEDGLPGRADELAEIKGLTAREDRMLRLGTMPLLECAEGIDPSRPLPPLVLALPETETAIPLAHEAFLERFALQTEKAFNVSGSTAGPRGRAGGLGAIARAAERVQEGAAPLALAGGIDTFRALYVLKTLEAEGRVKTPDNLDGFTPGEGAAFLLLGSREAAEAAGLTPLAAVSPVAEGFEEGHLYADEPYRGDGLAGTIETLLEQVELESPIREVYSSMNGESHWAREWGVAFIRNQQAFDPDHAMHHPADCYGDTGAACGPLMVGLAAIGLSQGYRQGPCLVYGSSDRGGRAALVVTPI